MGKVIMDFPPRITIEVFESMLSCASEQRRDKVFSFKFFSDRVQTILAYHLLQNELKQNYGIYEVPEFSFNKYGKPFLKFHPEIHFNLSHCKEAVLCVIDDKEIGCDVEIIPDKLDLGECEFCFNDSEIRDIQMASDPCVQFAKWWTMKEAYLKLIGTGLSDNLPDVFAPEVKSKIKFDTVVDLVHRIVYSICQYREC